METFEINQYFQSSQSAITSAAWEKKMQTKMEESTSMLHMRTGVQNIFA